jgi:hypothetical protein
MAFIADVFDVTLIDASGDVVATTTLQDAQIQAQVQANEVRGGKGNQLLGVLHAQRDITISLTDMEFRYDWIAKQLGQDIVTGAGVAYAMPKFYPVTGSTTLTITLDKAPTASGDPGLAIYDKTGKKIASSGYSVSGSVVTITAAGILSGDQVEVRTYKYDTDPQTQTIVFDGSVFAKGVTAILETVEISGSEEIQNTLQYQFFNAVPDGNFTINTQSQKNAVTQAFAMKVLKPATSNVVGQLLRIPYAG